MDELSIVAYHEAGHALLAERLGGHVLMATIEPVDDDGPRRHGETQIAWRTADMTRQEFAMRQLQVALAGPVAEMIYSDEQYEPRLIREWWADWIVATASIRELKPAITDDEVLQFVNKVLKELIAYFSQDETWDRLAMLADHLEAHQSLDEDLLDELRQSHVL